MMLTTRDRLAWWRLKLACLFHGHDWQTVADVFPEGVYEGNQCRRCFKWVKTWG